jgi:hypothetical protein
LAEGLTSEETIDHYPSLQIEDIRAAVACAARWRERMSGRWLHENQIGRNMGPSGSSFHTGAFRETRLEELAHRAAKVH